LAANSISCCVVGAGSNNLAGSSLRVQVASGNVGVGPANSPGAISITDIDNSSGNGNVNFCGDVKATGTLTVTSGNQGSVTVPTGTTASGGSVSITTPSLTDNGTIKSNTGTIMIQSNDPTAHALSISMGSGAAITAPSTQNINFNTTTA